MPTMRDFGIDDLSPEERFALALEIWDSLDAGPVVPPASPERRAELARRAEEMEAHPERSLTWEQIRASAEAKQ